MGHLTCCPLSRLRSTGMSLAGHYQKTEKWQTEQPKGRLQTNPNHNPNRNPNPTLTLNPNWVMSVFWTFGLLNFRPSVRLPSLMPWIQLRFDYDPTTTHRARLLPFDASKKWTCQSFVVVVSQSNRNCNTGLTHAVNLFVQPTSMVSRHIESSWEPRNRNGRMRVGPTLETGKHGCDSDEWCGWFFWSARHLISDDVHSDGYLVLNSVKPPSTRKHYRVEPGQFRRQKS